MDIETIKKGLTGVGVILAEVAGFSVIAGKAKHILSSATALTVIGAAMLIFGKAIKDIGSLSIETIGKGLIGIGGALAAVAVAVNLMPKNMVGIGLGLLEVAAALKIIGSVIQDAGGMKWEEIGKGMVVLAGSMTILAVALNAMKGTLGGASAMLVMSAALAVFTPVLKSLGSMSLAEIGKGLLALAGAFTVLGIAGAVLGPMVPAILGLSGALALLGVAVAACGVGILAFSAGLASLAVSGVAGVTALVAALEILIVGVLGIIANSATAIAGAVKAIILAIVDVIVECAPPIAEGVLTLIEEVLKSLAEHGPNIVTYLMDFLIGVINAIAAHHGDCEPTTTEAVLVAAADAISGARPGARRETGTNYVKRLEKLEQLAGSFRGVDKCYAIQAGREIRIMVVPEQVSDADMVILARDVSKQIESQLQYPGQIKVNVIRESRVIDYAK